MNKYNLREYQKIAIQKCYNLQCIDTFKYIVVPTGGGKSLIIKEVVNYYIHQGKKCLLLCHDARILHQFTKIFDVDYGIYCAGLSEIKDLSKDLVIASPQSLINCDDALNFDIIIIDECHRIPERKTSQYDRIIAKIPDSIKLGFTATPYRQDAGVIPDEQILYEITAKELINQGYLSPLIYYSDASIKESDFDKIPKSVKDFNPKDLEDYYSDKLEQLLSIAFDKIINQNRRKTLIFGVSIEHVTDISNTLAKLHPELNIGVIHSKLSKQIILDTIEQFRKGTISVLINCDMLTTGFDVPDVDSIIMLRATTSTSLWVQIVGRGTRIHPNKKDCLVFDFGSNINRHGKPEEITTKTVAKIFEQIKKRNKNAKWSPYRTCVNCGFMYEREKECCPECEHKPEKRANIKYSQVLRLAQQGHFIQRIDSISLERHKKKGSPDSLKLVVNTGEIRANNFYCFDHDSSFVRSIARKEFAKLFNFAAELPNSNAVDYALEAIQESAILEDVTHVELFLDKSGFYKCVNLFCSK